MISEKEKVLKLMAKALLEIRVEANEIDNQKIFKLADLFHNLPYILNENISENGNFLKIMDQLQSRAKIKGLMHWVKNSCQELEKNE